MALWGSLTLRNTTLGPDPYWRCLIDGSEVEHPLPLPDGPSSNYAFCANIGLSEGSHTLQLNAIIQSETLYIDQAQYLPAAGADVGSAWIQVGRGDARLTYSSEWTTSDNGFWKWTYTSGAWLTYDFNGA